MRTEAEAPTFDMSDPSLWVPKFLPLLHTTKRKRIVYGSRGDGKSRVAAQYTLMRLLDSTIKTRGLMVRKVRDQIKESQYQTLYDLVDEYGWLDYFNFSKSTQKITAFNGNCMIALGMDTSGKAKSIPNPNFAWIEEADELEEEDYRQLTLSLRGQNVEEVLTFNTPYEDHWLVPRFFPGHWEGDQFVIDKSFESPDGMFTEVTSTDPHAFMIHGCYLQNPFCPANIIEEMELERTRFPEEYRRTGLGLIGRRNIGSRWLKKFNYRDHVRKVQYEPGLPVHLAYDQNNLPYMTQLCIQLVNVTEADTGQEVTEVRFFKEYCIPPPKNSTEELCGEFIYDFGGTNPMVFVYGEPGGDSSTAKKTKNEAKHHYFVIQKELAPFMGSSSLRVKPMYPSIKGRQRFMEVVLSNGTRLRIVIDPSCRHIIGDFENLVEDENGGFVKKKVKNKETEQTWEERGHCMDAIVYFFHQCYGDLYKFVAKV